MNTQPPLNWLRSFVVAAQLLSFTRAASKLSLTQAAISKHIKGLEAWLGVQLFIRQAHGLQLTEQGKRYHLSCSPLLAQLELITQQFSAHQQASRLRLRCNISYSAMVLPSKLALLQRRFPDAAIDISNGIFEPDNPSQNAHLEVGYALRSKLEVGETVKILFEDQLFPVVAPHIEENEVQALPLMQVHGYTSEWRWWLDQQLHSEQSDCLDQWLLSHQKNRLPALRSDNSLTTYQLCAQGLGIALGRTVLVQPLLDSGELKKLSPARALPAPEVFFARLSKTGVGHETAEALFDLL